MNQVTNETSVTLHDFTNIQQTPYPTYTLSSDMCFSLTISCSVRSSVGCLSALVLLWHLKIEVS